MTELDRVNNNPFKNLKREKRTMLQFPFGFGCLKYLTVILIITLCEFTELAECGSNSKKKSDPTTPQTPERQVIYSVNAGGGEHTDVHGIKYLADTLQVGTPSSYGNRLNHIGRSHRDDETLYRTERYSETTFGYNIPIKEDGLYVLVLKFCEVYFRHAGEKVFDVTLNSKHVIVPDLDIFAAVGFGNAHQEIIPFKVAEGGKKLIVLEEDDSVRMSEIKRGHIRLEFVKIRGHYDNPKINAFYVAKGKAEDVPPLPALAAVGSELFPDDEDEEDGEFGDFYEMDAIPGGGEESFQHSSQRRYKPSVSGVQDPWEDVSVVTTLAPVVLTILIGAAAIGLIFRRLKNT